MSFLASERERTEEGINSEVVRGGVAFMASARDAGTSCQRKAAGRMVSRDSSFLPQKSRGRSS